MSETQGATAEEALQLGMLDLANGPDANGRAQLDRQEFLAAMRAHAISEADIKAAEDDVRRATEVSALQCTSDIN